MNFIASIKTIVPLRSLNNVFNTRPTQYKIVYIMGLKVCRKNLGKYHVERMSCLFCENAKKDLCKNHMTFYNILLSENNIYYNPESIFNF